MLNANPSKTKMIFFVKSGKNCQKYFPYKKKSVLIGSTAQKFEPHGLLPLLEMNGKEKLWKHILKLHEVQFSEE